MTRFCSDNGLADICTLGAPSSFTEWWGAGMVICLGRDADLHMAQLITLPLTISCSVNPDWFYLSGTSSSR